MCVLNTSYQTVEFNCTTGYYSILWCHDTADLQIAVLALLCLYVLTECCSVSIDLWSPHVKRLQFGGKQLAVFT